MKLQLGKMKTADLAKWFGISLSRLHNATPQFYEKLNNFCDYEKVYGGVIIKEIYFDTYDKKFDVKMENFIIKEIIRCINENEGLSTISEIARLFCLDHKDIGERAACKVISKTLNKLFGVTKELTSIGEIGSREYVWGIKIDNYNHYRFLTEEEDRIFNDIITNFYSHNPEVVKKAALLNSLYRRHEISQENYLALIAGEDSDYLSFSNCI